MTRTDHGAADIAVLATSGAAAIIAAPIIAVAASPPATPQHQCRSAPHPAPPAENAIPSDYLARYQTTGTTSGIAWTILAAIGKVESDHGQGTDTGIRTGHNQAGAMGPMQILADTWHHFGVDGDHDGHRNVYDPDDAIPAAARYLHHQGAPHQLNKALFAYNHSPDYIRLVLRWSTTYARGDFQTSAAACDDPSQTTQTKAAAAKIIAFAMAQRGKKYILGAQGPDAWDCSSLVQAAYHAAGLHIPRTTFEQWPYGTHIPKGTEQPGDLVFFNSGPGTAPNRPGHVGLVTTPGKMIAARCATCQPNIGVQSYKRSDWIGSTRPLLKLSSRS